MDLDAQVLALIALVAIVVALFGSLALRAFLLYLAERSLSRAVAEARARGEAIIQYDEGRS